MAKVLITSDWHLDKVTAGVDRYSELRCAVNDIVATAIAKRVDLFLFTGDLCDPDTGGDAARTHRAIAFAHHIAQVLQAEGIRSAWLAGNHDVIEDGHGTTTLSALSSAAQSEFNVFEQPQSDVAADGDIALIALPYTARSHRYDPDGVIRKFSAAGVGERAKLVLIAGHLMIEGIEPGSETKDMPRGRDVMFPYKAICECFPNAVLVNGHYHKNQTYYPPKRKGPPIHIPGPIARLTFGEEKLKPGFLMLEA